MGAFGLMSRAKEMVQRRAVGSALVIVPLAAAAPACANSVFILGPNSITAGASGGAFGHVNSALSPTGEAVELSGDTITSNGSYLTAGMAAQSSFDGVTAHIVFQWSGTFDPTSSVSLSDNLSLITSISPQILPPGSGTVDWSLDAIILNADDDVLVDETVSSSDVGNSFLQPIAQADTPDSWLVTLTVNWSFPMTYSSAFGASATPAAAGDQLNVNPVIDMTIVSPSGTTLPVPLPAAFWSGGSLLGLVVTGAFFRKLRLRRTS